MSDKISKPWYRLRNICLALLSISLITIAWASNEVWTVYTSKPNPEIDYCAKLQLLAEQHARVSHINGAKSWTILLNALAKAVLINRDMEAQISQRGFVARHEYDDGSIEYDRVYSGRNLPNDFERETDTIKLMQEEGVFKLLQQFTESGKGIRQFNEDLPLIVNISNQYHADARLLAKVLAASMRISFAEGKYAQCATTCNQALALGSTISHQGSSIDYLVARAIESLTLREIQYELNEAVLNEKFCKRIMKSLDQHTITPIELVIEGERLNLKDHIQWIFSDDGDGDGYLVSDLSQFIMPGLPNIKQTIFGAATSRFSYPSKAELLNLVDQGFDECIKRSIVLSSFRISLDPPWDHIDLSSNDRYVLVNMPVRSMLKVLDMQPTKQVLREGTRIMLALEIYYDQNAHWPNSLNELVPSILPRLPVDPLNGKPFGYRIVDNDRFGRPYFIYSFGLDSMDNGGIESNSGNDDVYRGMEALNDHNLTGIDYIINKPRREEW